MKRKTDETVPLKEKIAYTHFLSAFPDKDEGSIIEVVTVAKLDEAVEGIKKDFEDLGTDLADIKMPSTNWRQVRTKLYAFQKQIDTRFGK